MTSFSLSNNSQLVHKYTHRIARNQAILADLSENVTPRIYVACLAAHSHGRLDGRWLEATGNIEVIWSDISALLKNRYP